MSLMNFNPGIYNTFGPDLPGDDSGNEDKGKVLDWIMENGEDAVGIDDGVLCVINPRRPGCRGSGSASTNTTVLPAQNNNILYAILGVVVVLLIVFIFKK